MNPVEINENAVKTEQDSGHSADQAEKVELDRMAGLLHSVDGPPQATEVEEAEDRATADCRRKCEPVDAFQHLPTLNQKELCERYPH